MLFGRLKESTGRNIRAQKNSLPYFLNEVLYYQFSSSSTTNNTYQIQLYHCQEIKVRKIKNDKASQRKLFPFQTVSLLDSRTFFPAVIVSKNQFSSNSSHALIK